MIFSFANPIDFGLEEVASKKSSMGIVRFFNSETKKQIAEVSVAKSNDELINAIANRKRKTIINVKFL